MTVDAGYGVTAVPRIDPTLAAFVQEIRAYMRDYSELNRLTDGEENSDRMIVWAVIDTLEDFNSTPPPISLPFSQIPKSLLRYGVVTTLLESVMLLSARNHLAYSDGGINVNLDRTPLLMQMREMMRNTYDMKKKEFKIAKNIEGAYESSPSEYFLLTGYYGVW